jgi:hypothetical protein
MKNLSRHIKIRVLILFSIHGIFSTLFSQALNFDVSYLVSTDTLIRDYSTEFRLEAEQSKSEEQINNIYDALRNESRVVSKVVSEDLNFAQQLKEDISKLLISGKIEAKKSDELGNYFVPGGYSSLNDAPHDELKASLLDSGMRLAVNMNLYYDQKNANLLSTVYIVKLQNPHFDDFNEFKGWKNLFSYQNMKNSDYFLDTLFINKSEIIWAQNLDFTFNKFSNAHNKNLAIKRILNKALPLIIFESIQEDKLQIFLPISDKKINYIELLRNYNDFYYEGDLTKFVTYFEPNIIDDFFKIKINFTYENGYFKSNIKEFTLFAKNSSGKRKEFVVVKF